MMEKRNKNKGLGRGLSALMSDIQPVNEPSATGSKSADQLIPIEKISPNPDQPRRRFEQDKLDELAASIAEKGVIQPIIVRKNPTADDEYQIVAGERRWRAAQLAQLHEVPALVRDFNDTEVLEVAIIENIQRADLNSVDEAAGYKALMSQFGHTQEQLATVLGKSRSHIANMMRLLNLPDQVLELLAQNKISAGHARALIGHDDAVELAQKIVTQNLSVRDVEKLVKGPISKPTISPARPADKDADTVQIERDLAAQLGLKVSIDHKAGTDGGKVTLNYKSLEQLDDLLRLLSGQ